VLIPQVWQGYNLKLSSQGESQPSNDVMALACDWPDDSQGQHQYPFANAMSQNQFWWSPPTTDLTHYIYGKDSADSDNGAYEFGPVWWRDTYNPPGHTLCVKSPGSANYWSTQYSPSNITLKP
jgi:hypothetical protein